MSRRPNHLDQVAEQMNAADDLKAARHWHERSIFDTDAGLRGYEVRLNSRRSAQEIGWLDGRVGPGVSLSIGARRADALDTQMGM